MPSVDVIYIITTRQFVRPCRGVNELGCHSVVQTKDTQQIGDLCQFNSVKKGNWRLKLYK